MAAPYLALEGSTTLRQPPARVKENAYVKNLAQYHEMYQQSITNSSKFWYDIATTKFYWQTPPSEDAVCAYNYDRSQGKPVSIEWFKGGVTNICYNCLDRHVLGDNADKVAFYWEGNSPTESATFTYSQLLYRVKKFANVLKSAGVKKGDTVAIYLPMVIELVIATLACARIGAIHSIVFGGFSAEAFADRIMDASSRVVVTADGVLRGEKEINLKSITNDAISMCQERGFKVEECIVVKNLGDRISAPWVQGRDRWCHEEESIAQEECPVEWVDAETPLFLLYTSGSTGKPKGVVHTTGGYMVWTATTMKYTFDYHENDVYWCTADIGWITGHSYIVYGPMANAATSVMFEGIPTFPDAGRFWELVQKHKVTQFYTAPTAIRALQRFGNDFPKKYDLSSLRILGTVGEPINPEAWLWYNEVIGNNKCSIVDTFWQTETGGHMLTGLPGATPMKPGSASLPMFGVVPAVVDEQGVELQGAVSGFLAIKNSWPGQMRTVFGDHERFERTYYAQFNGYYTTGDGCRRDEDGYYWITGRTDDVINVSGHRMGTAELEAALARHKSVVEAAIVAVPHEIKGQSIYAFVILKPGFTFSPQLEKDLKGEVRKDIGAFAAPDTIQEAPGLPKTRSGKIMRRILRKIATYSEEELGDISTLADPNVVQQLLQCRPPRPWVK